MNSILKIFISILLFYIIVPRIAARETKSTVDTIPEQHFNALNYSLQKRYKPPGEPFVNNKPADNMYITLSTGIESLVKRGNTGFGTGPQFAFTIGKHINQINSLRATLFTGWYTREEKDFDLFNTGLHLTHLFNISSYANGYNPNRVFEISTIEGVGYQISSLDEKKRGAANLHVGLQLKIHPNPRMDIMIEPRASFYTDGIDHSSKQNWHGFDVGYGATVGINYRFTPSGTKYSSAYLFDEISFFDNTFIAMGGGTQLPMSNDILKNIGLGSSLGSHFSISAGKWIIPMLGFQASMFTSFHKWGKSELPTKYLSSYNGGRIEAILNFLSFFNMDIRNLRFGVTGSLGVELARIYKETENYTDNIKHGYAGITGAVQFKYYTNNNIGLFIEPRFSRATYPVYYTQSGIDKVVRQNYKDNVCAINFGIELKRADQIHRMEAKASKKEFIPYLFTGINAGFNFLLAEERFNKNTGYQINTQIGYQFTPLSSLRTGVSFASYQEKENNITINTFQIPVGYLFNLTNYIAGYNKNRSFNTGFLTGFIFSIPIDYSSNFRVGGETGFQFSYKITQQVSLLFEPTVRIYGKKFISEAAIKGLNFIPSLSFGTAYQF